MMVYVNWRDYGPSPLPRILQTALEAFVEHGYEGTSVRDLAGRAGLSVPGLYHHFRSKQDILMGLLEAVMNDLLARSRSALSTSPPNPEGQLDALVECMLRFHLFRRNEAFVASTELRSLEPANRGRYVRMRDEQQRMLADVIRAGSKAGVFTTPYPDDAARALATLCVGVATWYRDDGPLAPDEVVRRYLDMVHGLVGVARMGS
ncbi:TetR/AcrR family transcriptional regulator [Dactylosporangium sp. NPDC051484]|uniref:TetR/AcrR family transcriptional regulator n=1 Tax=Dactylosporangium sp. NPDC051484 TaxID=3154942 RepID=UPI00344B2B57